MSLPPEYKTAEEPGWRLMSAILRRWIEEASVPVVLCPIPTFAHVFKTASADDYRARFAELAAEMEVELIDLLPAIWEHPRHVLKRSRFPQDEHPNRLGHRLLADALAPHLERYTRAGAN